MTSISAKALRYGLMDDLNINGLSMEKLPKARRVSRSTFSVFMMGKGGTKPKDMLTKIKIYNYYKSISQNPASFEMFWGIDKEFYEVV